jgi:cytoskeletal protein CcmA (bactofilin family)
MLSSKKPNYERPATLIGKDTVIDSSLVKSKSSIQVNGVLNGNIDCDASVVIGQTGKVVGNVKAGFLLIAGTIEGQVEVKNQLHVNKTANILGDVHCGSIIIDDGAVLNGSFSMNEQSKSKSVSDSDKKEKKN